MDIQSRTTEHGTWRHYAHAEIDACRLAPLLDEAKNGGITNALVLSGKHPDPHLFSLKWALAYQIVAKKAFDSENFQEAWPLLAEAMYRLGFAGFHRNKTYYDQLPMVESRHRVNGGLQRANAYLPVKEFAVRLLNEKKPTEGWPSKIEAIRSITPELSEFVSSGKFNLVISNLWQTLNTWSRKDVNVEAAFNSVVKPKKNH